LLLAVRVFPLYITNVREMQKSSSICKLKIFKFFIVVVVGSCEGVQSSTPLRCRLLNFKENAFGSTRFDMCKTRVLNARHSQFRSGD